MSVAEEPPRIYRVPIRSGTGDVDHTELVEYCLRHGIVGIGWGLFDDTPDTLPQTLQRVRDAPGAGWGKRAAGTIARFAGADEGSFCWTRHTDGTWLLARITGPWRPNYTRESELVGVHQVRDVEWARRPLLDVEVPGGVVRAFAGRGSSFSQIHDESARVFSAHLWAELTGAHFALPRLTQGQVLRDLGPLDVEDFVYSYLQAALGYLVLPAAWRPDTPAYEATLIHRETGRLAIAQVKTGNTAVDMQQLAHAAGDEHDAFAYSTRKKYVGDDRNRIVRIKDDQLLAFARSSPQLVPPRARRWLQYAD